MRLQRINPTYMNLTLNDTEQFRYAIPKLVQSQQYSVLETLLGEVEQSARERFERLSESDVAQFREVIEEFQRLSTAVIDAHGMGN